MILDSTLTKSSDRAWKSLELLFKAGVKQGGSVNGTYPRTQKGTETGLKVSGRSAERQEGVPGRLRELGQAHGQECVLTGLLGLQQE